MMMKLTKKQTLIVDFINDFTAARGESPSYREIMTALGLSSVSAVAEHIDNLVAKGVVKKTPGAARSLEILNFRHPETVDFFKERLLTVSPAEAEILRQAADILGLDLS